MCTRGLHLLRLSRGLVVCVVEMSFGFACGGGSGNSVLLQLWSLVLLSLAVGFGCCLQLHILLS
jgi:hypothetical protein